jgi:hypothetical protein
VPVAGWWLATLSAPRRFRDSAAMGAEEGKSGPQTAEVREALERFVVDNDDLLDLESRIGRFNIFDALGIARVEIRHSNFLAFILDPAESHGQGPLFLKAVLMDLLKKAGSDSRPLSPIDLDGANLRGVEVKREWKNIDLLITCKEPRFAVVIENKVGSKDHSNQLNRYSETVKGLDAGRKPLYVYLTPGGEDPSQETREAWLNYSYEELYGVLKRVRDMHEKSIGGDVLVFLDHYLDLLRTRFMNDQELQELCERIYKNHRQALDMIWERIGTAGSRLLPEVANAVKADGRWRVVWQNQNVVNSVPVAWLKWLPPLGSYYDDDPRIWIVLKIELSGSRLDFFIEMHGVTDQKTGERIARVLFAEAPKCGFKRSSARKLTNFTHVSGRECMLEWGEDDEPEPEAILMAVKRTLDDLYPRIEKLALVLKPLCK